MDYFDSIDSIVLQWPYEGDITFKGLVKTLRSLQEVYVKISPFDAENYLVCVIKQEDYELCCQVLER